MRLLLISISIAALLPCSSILAQDEPCDLNHNGFVDISDLVWYMNVINHITSPPYDLPFYDPFLDCDRDGLHLTINDLVGLGCRLIYGYGWGQGRQWWLPLDSLYIPEIEISPGDLIDVPVYMQADHPLTNVQFALRYDPKLLQIDDFIVSDSVPGGYPPRVYTFDGGISVIVALAAYDDEVFYSGHLGNLRVSAFVGSPQELETVIEFFTEPRRAFHNGITSRKQLFDPPSIELLFVHPTTMDGIIRIVTEDRRDMAAVGSSQIVLDAYPNPFNSSVEFAFQLRSDAEVEVAVYDLLGRKVAHLYDGRLSAGRNALIWRPDDQPSGVYFCCLTLDDGSISRRIILLR